MKRRLSILLLLCSLLALCLPFLPAGAEAAEGDRKTLSYHNVGAECDDAELTALSSTVKNIITTDIELCFHADEIVVKMNNRELPSGYVIDTAGTYEILVYDKATYNPSAAHNESVKYSIEYQPKLKVLVNSESVSVINGRVFDCYPVFECENAEYMEIKRGTSTLRYAEDGEWPFPGEFGSYELIIHGKRNGVSYEMSDKKFTFSVYPCSATQLYDKEIGMQVLEVKAGHFDGIVKVMLDGKEIPAGTAVTVSEIGAHSVELFFNGVKIEEDRYSYFGIPSKEELTLRIPVEMDSLTWDYPDTLDFSKWNARICVNGVPVEGDIYIGEDGVYSISVVDEQGNVIPGCFLINADGESFVSDTLDVTFENPHYTYVIFIAIPAALLLIAAVFFLVLRRRVV